MPGDDVQHATARFHQGLALADAGDLGPAEESLVAAAAAFHGAAMQAEHGKAMNALGAVLRLGGRPEEAAEAFVRAAAALQAAGLRVERGAACFNLGLVRRESGRLSAAIAAFEDARALLEAGSAPAQAAAAARELGAAQLAAGELELAQRVLEESVRLAQRAGDEAGAGAAANVLGLVHLAAGRSEDAARAFQDALARHPRRLRPEDHAMAKANLALAHERMASVTGARLAARQALGVPAAPEPVRAQAQGILDRLGGAVGAADLLAVLDEEDPSRWPALVREEVVRWVDAAPDERVTEAGAWIDGQLARPAAAADLAEAWVGALLELPPEDLETVVRSVVEALGRHGPDARQRYRSDVAAATARFHVPQLLRLRDTFNRIAGELGEDAAWR